MMLGLSSIDLWGMLGNDGNHPLSVSYSNVSHQNLLQRTAANKLGGLLSLRWPSGSEQLYNIGLAI